MKNEIILSKKEIDNNIKIVKYKYFLFSLFIINNKIKHKLLKTTAEITGLAILDFLVCSFGIKLSNVDNKIFSAFIASFALLLISFAISPTFSAVSLGLRSNFRYGFSNINRFISIKRNKSFINVNSYKNPKFKIISYHS